MIDAHSPDDRTEPQLPLGAFRRWLRLLTNLREHDTVDQFVHALSGELSSMTGNRPASFFRARSGQPPQAQPLVGPAMPFPALLGELALGETAAEGPLVGATIYEDWREKVWLVLMSQDQPALEALLQRIGPEIGEMFHRLETAETLHANVLANLQHLRAARQTLVTRFRQLGSAMAYSSATREETVWEALRTVHAVCQSSVTLFLVKQPSFFRALALDRAQQPIAEIVREPSILRLLDNALASRRGTPLRGRRAQQVSEMLTRSPRLDWFYLVPIRADGYVHGLLGAGLTTVRWPMARDSLAAMAPDQVSELVSTTNQQVSQARWETVALLRAISEDVTAFIERGALFEAAYAAGAAAEGADLGMDIHDSVLQDLSYIRLQLETLRLDMAEAGPEAASILQDVASNVSRVSRDLRQLSVMLTSVDQTADLVDAIRDAVDKFRPRMNADFEVRIEGERRQLGYRTSSQLVRIVQEALNNAWKHADASRVEVILTYADERVSLAVVDNGRGFDPGQPSAETLGLRGMERRIRNVGGTLSIDSEQGRGTKVEVDIPV